MMIWPMPARSRAAVAAIALLLVAACSGGGHSSAAKTTTTTSTTAGSSTTGISTPPPSSTTSTAPVSSSCTAADPNGLAGLVPQRIVPAGFVVQPDTANQTGPTDFNKAVTDDGEKDAATVLKQDGFRRGYQRLWAHQDGRKVIAVVYEFCSVGGAKAYATRAAKLGTNSTTSPFTVSGIPDAVGLASHDSTSSTALVQATPGRYVIVASINAPTTAATQAQAEQLATDVAKALVGELTANV